MKLPVEPIIFEPHFEEKVWGGNRLKRLFGKDKDINPDKIIGECWVISAIEKKESFIKEGSLAGENLRSLYARFPGEILGKNYKKYPIFPLLIKFIDARENLSIQVHPKDYLEKNECWFIVDTGNKGAIATGLNKKISKEELLDSVRSKKIEELLNIVKVKKNEVYFIPVGTVHAILEDVLIYEVQQTSNITYRIYDWDRKPSSSTEPRPLQIEKALEVTDLEGNKECLVPPIEILSTPSYSHYRRISYNYFIVEEYLFYKKEVINLKQEGKVKIITAISCCCTLEWNGKTKEITPGNTVLIPAILSQINLIGSEGCRIIVSTVP